MKKNTQFRKKLAIGLFVFVLLLSITITPISGSILIQKEQSLMTKDCTDGIILNGTIGGNGWYISPVTITFDNENGSWVHCFVSIDSGSWFEYTGPIVICIEGSHFVKWYYIDQLGNQSAEMVVFFKIDMTPPAITLNYTWEGNPWCGYVFIFTATCIDAMSGMEKVEFYFNQILAETVMGSGPDYVWSYEWLNPCDITVKVITYDNAGWTNSAEIINPHSTQSQSQLIQSLILRHHIMNLFLG